ncbi:MAG: 16S rRNA (guanine(527)-N(7))-methyltransferase RsmG [Bacteroidota bacterium]
MQEVLKYFPETESQKAELLTHLKPLYEEWNQKINVISRKDMNNFYLHHVLHSLAIAKVFQFKPGTSVADIGTGGGFPGIPLAVFFPEVEFVLVDSIEKKMKVVRDVTHRLGLHNVECIRNRAENLEQKFDFVVSRAVTSLPVFMQWTKGKIKKEQKHIFPNGVIYLKGGDLTHELAQVEQKQNIINISDFFEEDFFLTKKIIHLYA